MPVYEFFINEQNPLQIEKSAKELKRILNKSSDMIIEQSKNLMGDDNLFFIQSDILNNWKTPITNIEASSKKHKYSVDNKRL